MTQRHDHRTILWPVGLSSLILVAPLLCFFILQEKTFWPGQTMEVNLPPSREKADAFLRNPPGVAPGGEWKLFKFVGSAEPDSTMNAALDKALRAHLASYDTVNGIRIHFDRKARYGTFVAALDEINIAGLQRYAIVGLDIWVPCFPQHRKSILRLRPPFICGGFNYPAPTQCNISLRFWQVTHSSLTSGSFQTRQLLYWPGRLSGTMSVRAVRKI